MKKEDVKLKDFQFLNGKNMTIDLFSETSMRLIQFGQWLENEGWKYYDCNERMINGRSVELLKNLFAEFEKENPEP